MDITNWKAIWNQNTEQDLAGYFLYWRYPSQGYSEERRIDCGLQTTVVIKDVVPIGTYIVITAYDDSGNESNHSEEVFFWGINMSLQDDIDKIKAMQDAYLAQYGEYFETDNSKIVTIPMPGEDKELTQFTRFKPNRDKAPNTLEKIAFIPDCKDWKFIIGQVVFVNSAEGGYDYGVEKRAYMICAQRKNALGDKVEQHTFYGGDQFVIDNFTDGDKSEEIDYKDSLDNASKLRVKKDG